MRNGRSRSPRRRMIAAFGSAIGRISIAEAMKSIWPFFLAAITVLMLVTFIPQLSLTLPAIWR